MIASLRALLQRSLDYAGLFPPARLPLEQALRNYALYRQGGDSWLLGTFVCPTTRLLELKPYQTEIFSQGPTFAFSLVGRGGSTFVEWLGGLRADLSEISSFLDRHGPQVRLETFEIRLPDDLAQAGSAEIAARLSAAAGVIAHQQLPPLTLCYESPRSSDWRRLTPTLLEIISPACLKIRCGGVTASAFPTSEQLASTLHLAAARNVRLKFTAGLHHPLRQSVDSTGPGMHGFFTLFLAGVLARSNPAISEQVLRSLLEETNPKSFILEDASLRWREVALSTQQMEQARQSLVLSFGSCSFDEPLADLRALGWL